MDLPSQIGSHCAIESCNVNDFLPIRCPYCSSVFCRDHASPADKHQCVAAQRARITGVNMDSDGKITIMKRCKLDGCEKVALGFDSISMGERGAIQEGGQGLMNGGGRCPACGGAFCASHRHESSHACPGPTTSHEVEEKNAKAKSLLAKAFPVKDESKAADSASSSSVPAASSQATYRRKPLTPSQKKIELMRMRHKATPVDVRFERKGVTIPNPESRRFFKAKVQNKGIESGEKVLWSMPDMIGGRVLDSLGRIFKVGSGNSPTRLQRIIDSGAGEQIDTVELQLSNPIGEQTEDGDTLLLVIASE
ncbi:hypothetical protein FRB98_003189 [Tulasnella sp. 332]|nr:hypothetical protein FRB98_003189 [Tulasnella sp. 332]